MWCLYVVSGHSLLVALVLLDNTGKDGLIASVTDVYSKKTRHCGVLVMEIFLGIDDTDNPDSRGSGSLAEVLAASLAEKKIVAKYAGISRHQLFVHREVPFTSHNSSMCFSACLKDADLQHLISFSQHFLAEASAPGADPGLCVTVIDDTLDRQGLIDFGLRAKSSLLTKQDAYCLAEKTGVYLSEHGGTGGGVIGALAGVGLRLDGNDGRFRGWFRFGDTGEILSCEQLCAHPAVDDVVDVEGQALPKDSRVVLSEEKVKTICMHHRQVVPVTLISENTVPRWRTLFKKEVTKI